MTTEPMFPKRIAPSVVCQRSSISKNTVTPAKGRRPKPMLLHSYKTSFRNGEKTKETREKTIKPNWERKLRQNGTAIGLNDRSLYNKEVGVFILSDIS